MEDISQESRGSTRAAIAGEHHHQQQGHHHHHHHHHHQQDGSTRAAITGRAPSPTTGQSSDYNKDSGIFIEYYSMILLKKGPILSNMNSNLYHQAQNCKKHGAFYVLTNLGRNFEETFLNFLRKKMFVQGKFVKEDCMPPIQSRMWVEPSFYKFL